MSSAASTSADSPSGAAVIGPDGLVALRRDNPSARIIDVRTPVEFASGHIPGSYNVPLPDLAEHRLELTDAAAGPVVLVCRSGRRAETAGRQLVALGLPDVHVLAGGVVAWESLQPLARLADAGGWTIERQVRAVAGGVVAASVVASVWWSPARFVAGAIGAGLLVAALTDTCAMGNVLGRLPYNRRRRGTCDLPTVVATLAQPSSTSTSDSNRGDS